MKPDIEQKPLIKMKPCPFCGGVAHKRFYASAYSIAVDVQCTACGVTTERCDGERSIALAEERAVEAWNRRVANDICTAGKPVRNADRFKTADEAIAAAIHTGIVDCRFGAREMAEWLLAPAPVTIEDGAE